MGDLIRCVSGHSEVLADGREVPRGEYASDVDLKDDHNKTLLEEGKIIKLTAAEGKKAGNITPIPAPPKPEPDPDDPDGSQPDNEGSTR